MPERGGLLGTNDVPVPAHLHFAFLSPMSRNLLESSLTFLPTPHSSIPLQLYPLSLMTFSTPSRIRGWQLISGQCRPYAVCTLTPPSRLLTAMDTSARKLPRFLQKLYYHAMSRLPLTYPWASFILDLKDVLPAYDCHLIACLLANMVVGCVPYYSIWEQLVNSFSIS